MKKMLLLTLGTSVLSALVISNAYATKQQFYTTVVYLLNSNRTLGVLYLQAAVLVWVITTVVKKTFFGTLRAAEVEHLVEKSWYAVLETFILLAGFHQDLQLAFVGSITLLFVMKAFHWLTEERIDYMERSPLITWLFHVRAVTFLLLLITVDCLYIHHSWNSLKSRGASVQIVFGLEYAIMFLVAVNTFFRYILHSIDLRSEDPWENKAIYMRYVDIVIGFFKLLLYISYMAFMLWILFIPLHIIRRIYITAKNFQKSVHDVISSHQAIRNLNTLYPDATVEELQEVNTLCIICREEMIQRCKKLPCGHIFHTTCLHSWFQRQQVCPTCRMDVLSQNATARRNRRQQPPAQPAQRGGRGGAPPPGVAGQPGLGGLFHPMMPPPMWPPPGMGHPPPPHGHPLPAHPAPPHPPPPHGHPAPAAEAAAGQPQQPPAASPPTQGEREGADEEGQPSQEDAQPAPPPHSSPAPPHAAPPMGGLPPNSFPPFFPPPFMMPPPFGMVPPYAGMPSADTLRSLSDEELRSLEGMERANVEARIAVLRNVQRLLDTAVAQLTQYSTVMASMGSAAGPGFPGYPHPPPFTAGTSGTASQSSTPPDATTAPPQSQPHPPPHPPHPVSTPAQRQLVEGERDFSFSAAELSQSASTEGEGQGGGGGGGGEGGVEEIGATSLSKEDQPISFSVGAMEDVGDGETRSPEHVNELRQRRLQRFHSMPSPLRDSGIGEMERERETEAVERETGRDGAPQRSMEEQKEQ